MKVKAKQSKTPPGSHHLSFSPAMKSSEEGSQLDTMPKGDLQVITCKGRQFMLLALERLIKRRARVFIQ